MVQTAPDGSGLESAKSCGEPTRRDVSCKNRRAPRGRIEPLHEHAFGNDEFLPLREARDEPVPVLVTTDDFDFDAQEIDRHLGLFRATDPHGETDRVFFRGHSEIEIPADTTRDEVREFLFPEPMMIGKAGSDYEICAERLQAALETLRLCDAAEDADVFVPQFRKRQTVRR